MTNVVERMTPAHYKPIKKAFIEWGDGEVTIEFVVNVLNVQGNQVCGDTPVLTLTPEEIQTFQAIYARGVATYEIATGLIEWIEP